MSSGTDKLFLLEFVVDSVNIEILPPSTSKEDESSVMFQFLNNPAVDVHEKDFSPKQSNMKGGKSCLFALPPEISDRHINEFPVFIQSENILSLCSVILSGVFTSIKKKTAKGRIIDVGSCKILITSLFSEILKKVQEVPDCLPVSKSMKDKFLLRNVFGDDVGSITVYLRLSCFGKVIVTQFHIGAKSSYMFKGDDSDSIFRCKKSLEESQVNQITPSSGDSCSLGRGVADGIKCESPKHVKPPSEPPGEPLSPVETPITCRTPLTPQSREMSPGFQELPSYESLSAVNKPSWNAPPPSFKYKTAPGNLKSFVCSGTLLQKDNLDSGDDLDGYTQSLLQMLKGKNIVPQQTSCEESNSEYISESKELEPSTTELMSKPLNTLISDQVKCNSYNCNLSQSELGVSVDETNKVVAYSLPKSLPVDMQVKPIDSKSQTIDELASKVVEQTPLFLPPPPPRFETRETQYMESDFPASIGDNKPEKTSRKCKSKSKDRVKKMLGFTKGKKGKK